MAATLHMIFGKAGSGKSTLARTLAASSGTILVSQDPWMAALFKDELQTIDDYVRLVPRLHAAMGPHLAELLRAGLDVVLDWPANTRRSRRWMGDIAQAAGATAVLHVLDVPDAVCLARLRERNASGAHEFTLSEDEFADLVARTEPVSPDEGFETVAHTVD